MIKIKVYINKEEIQGFEVSGHALLAPEGEDVVCAAVSMVTQSALLGLLEYLNLDIEGKVEKGQINCHLPSTLTEVERLQANAILETMVLGLESIAQDYPEIIKIIKEEVSLNDD